MIQPFAGYYSSEEGLVFELNDWHVWASWGKGQPLWTVSKLEKDGHYTEHRTFKDLRLALTELAIVGAPPASNPHVCDGLNESGKHYLGVDPK